MGRQRATGSAPPDRDGLNGSAGSYAPAPADQPPRATGSQLIHDLGGTLAAIGLHLRMAAAQPLPQVSAQHIDAASTALHSSRSQLTQLAELLLGIERPDEVQRE